MPQTSPEKKNGALADWFTRGLLTRLGEKIDELTGRKWIPSSTLATSELIERLKKLLDAEARPVPDKGLVVPHNIKLKMQWDKFSDDAEDALASLETELLTAAVDHINDSLYYTNAPITLEVKPDYFTEGVKLYVSFDDIDDDEGEAELNVTMPLMNIDKVLSPDTNIADQPAAVFIARFQHQGGERQKELKFPAGGRLSVGRTGGSDLMLDDASVSKMHASLAVSKDGELSVADTGSTNGTFINGTRISYGKATRLNDGDRVTFGAVDVAFELVELAASPSDTGDTIEGDEIDEIEVGDHSSSVSDTSLSLNGVEKTVEIDPEPAPREGTETTGKGSVPDDRGSET